MKVIKSIKTGLSAIVLVSIFSILPFNESNAQQVVNKGADGQHIRVDLMGHSYFARMVMVSDFHKLESAKVVASYETGIIYIYPYGDVFDQLVTNVDATFSRVKSLEAEIDKTEQTLILTNLIAEHGEWLERYALSGERTTENDSCHNSMPFCTGTIYNFPAGTNTLSQHGPYYDCLATTPNPAWYHLRIQDAGPIGIYMFSTPFEDIDFCLWGPFTDPFLPCPMSNINGGLTSNKVVSCSYSTAATETASIPYGQPGEYYILIITNYSNAPCDITFQQTSGTGTTDCSILPPPTASNSPVCIGGNIQLNAAYKPGVYQWSGPNGFTSNLQNPLITGATTANAGTYTLTVTYNGVTTDPTTTEVFVYAPPTASISGSTVICELDSALITIDATSTGPFTAIITDGSGGIPQVINFTENTHAYQVHPASTSIYTLTSISNSGCPGVTTGQSVEVKVNPLPWVNLTNPDFLVKDGVITVCVFDTIMLDAGNPGAEYLWNNGSSEREFLMMAAGINFDYREYWVRVTNPVTGCWHSDTVYVAFAFSACSYGTDEIPLSGLVNIFPNPAGDFVNISIDGPSGDFEIQITDLSGRLLIEKHIKKSVSGISNHSVSLEGFVSGTYFVRLTSLKGVAVRKIVKN